MNTGKWKKSETNKMLEMFCSGTRTENIGLKLKRTIADVESRLHLYLTNKNGIAERYVPRRRSSRKGMRLTENEQNIIHHYREAGQPLRIAAHLMIRSPRELGLDYRDRKTMDEMKQIGTGVDLVLAYRLLYYVHGISIISDSAYDTLEKEELEFGAHSEVLKVPGSDRLEDYPPHIRALAIYLAFKYGKGQKETDEGPHPNP